MGRRGRVRTLVQLILTVVVVDPAAIVAAEPRGLHRLYVVLTRAVSTLVVLHTGDLPELLAA